MLPTQPLHRVLHSLQQRLVHLEALYAEPMSHPINETRKEEFINLCDKSVQPSIRKLLDNTRYVSFEEFKQRIDDNIPELLHLCKGHEIVYIHGLGHPANPKSNYWVFQILEELIQQEKYRYQYNFKFQRIQYVSKTVPENAFVVMLDDCMYSGLQMQCRIYSFLHTVQKKLAIHVFIPFSTKQAINRLIDESTSDENDTKPSTFSISKHVVLLQTTQDFLSDKEIEQIEAIYDHTFKVSNKALIYFDHKLADHTSTVPLIYSGLLANMENKKILSEINRLRDRKLDSASSELEQNRFIQQLQYHEFIENCIGVRNFDQECPLCPYPPYKSHKKHKKPKLSLTL